jgi:hypothetical protein
MSSPFATFRKNQTYWMAGLVLLAILAFIVAPALQIAGGMRPTQGDRVIVRWKGGRMTEAELERARQQHYRFIRFLSALSKEVLAAGGQPEVYSFYLEGKNIRDLGVNSQSDNLSMIETRLFAAYAKSNGIEFDDDAANQFLLAFCNNRIPTARMREILDETSDKQLTVFDLRELIKLEMAANVAKQMALRGWTREFKPDAISLVQMTQTPGDMWNDFLKLKQTARVEAYPILVSDFVKSVSGEPTEAEILEIYEAGKNRLAEPFLPDPGFMRPYRANFEFIEGGFNEWVDREKAKLSEEQLRAEYDRMVSLGQLKTSGPITPPVDPQAPATPGPTTPIDKADEAAPTPSTPAEPTAPEPKTTVPPTEKSSPTPKDQPATDAPAGESAPPAPDKKDQSSLTDSAVRLVSFQDEANTPGDQDLPPVVVQPGAPGDEKTAASAGTSATPAGAPAAAPAAEMRTKTFEEAKDEVARSLAQTAAMESLQKALTGVNEAMTKYSAAYRQHAVSEKAGFKTELKITRPSLKKLSQELGLVHGETGMIDRSKFVQTDLGRSFVDLQSQGLGQMPVARFGMSPTYDLYTPASSFFFNQMAATPDIRQYIFWKTVDQQAMVPELGEVREEVIAAWKTKKARLLAQSEAEKISKKITAGDDAWKDAITAEQKALVVSTDPFTWLSGLGETPQISNIPTLDTVGQEFMQKVFSAGEGKVGVAPNQGQNLYYVFRVVDLSPAINELQEQFSSDPAKFAVRRVGQVEGQRLYEGWYESIDERLQVKWEINVGELTGE